VMIAMLHLLKRTAYRSINNQLSRLREIHNVK